MMVKIGFRRDWVGGHAARSQCNFTVYLVREDNYADAPRPGTAEVNTGHTRRGVLDAKAWVLVTAMDW